MCPTCNNSTGPLVIGGISAILPVLNTPCTSTLCPAPQDSKCTFYSGGNLPCSGINTKDSLEVALQKIDTLLCASTGNYSSYNTFCLAPITTQQQFVEAISNFVCNTQTSLNTFINTTFPSYQSTTSARIEALRLPGTTVNCTSLIILNSDTLQVVLQKLANAVCNIYSVQLDLSTVNWSQCFTVSPAPTTLAQAFNVVLSQICQVATAAGVQLPVFNNTGSCLPSPGATDTLVDTVNKIKTRLCQTPTFDINALTWNCITKPSSVTTDLQSAVGAILSRIDNISGRIPNFSSDFAVASTDPSNPCSGVTVSLSSSIADRKVAATSTDGTPGTLQDKLISDSNLAWDFTNPTKAKITLVGGGSGASDGKVKTDVGDTADYLNIKIASGAVSNGIQILPSLDISSPDHQIRLNASVDPVALFTAILNALPANPTLQQALCSAIASCPSPCAAPSNVSVIYGGTTSSTTTTTTTAAPTTTTTSTTTIAPSTTSTTTTTTTTVALDNIYVFAAATGATPSSATILAGNHTTQLATSDVNADWTPFNGTPQFCEVAIPQRAGTLKGHWFVDVINNGTIGEGGDLFNAPVTVTVSGIPYDVYITSFATTFSAVCSMRT